MPSLNNLEVVTGKTPSRKKPEYFNGESSFTKTPDINKVSVIINIEEMLSEIGGCTQKNKFLLNYGTNI